MAGTRAGWESELGRWLKPFLERLGHKARQRMFLLVPIEIACVYGIYGCQPPAEPRAKPSIYGPSRWPPTGWAIGWGNDRAYILARLDRDAEPQR
jgi:hypothetical protein